ncbi:Hsp70 protein-domain-containing protein, partial [Amylocystis lapponica]
MAIARKYVPHVLSQWGKVQRIDGGDTIHASELVAMNENSRDATYVRNPEFVPQDFYGQLRRIFVLELPPSAELRTDEASTLLLAAIQSVKTQEASDVQQVFYKDDGALDVVDLASIQCVVGRVYDTQRNSQEGGESQMIAYDLGGGTFDVSLLSIDDSVFEVLAMAGDTHLGARTSITATRRSRHGRHGQPACAGQAQARVEKAKRTLSSQQSTRLEIESFEGGNDFTETLTRAKFEELNMDLFRKTMKPVEQVLKDANLKKEDIDEIVLVSGSTRIPKVQQLLKEYFGKEPSKGINPDEAVAYGAAVQGGILSGDETLGDVIGRCLPLDSRYRDHRWCHDEAHPPQHCHPHAQEPDV